MGVPTRKKNIFSAVESCSFINLFQWMLPLVWQIASSGIFQRPFDSKWYLEEKNGFNSRSERNYFRTFVAHGLCQVLCWFSVHLKRRSGFYKTVFVYSHSVPRALLWLKIINYFRSTSKQKKKIFFPRIVFHNIGTHEKVN